MKILITNSVPLNGGDQALLQATVEGLRRLLSDSEIELTILCSDSKNCSKYLPDFQFDWDYERTLFIYQTTFGERIKWGMRKILSFFVSPKHFFNPNALTSGKAQKNVYHLYQNADLIISSPGGYLHDFYGYEKRCMVFDMAFQLEKPVVLLAQSIGPFWKKDQLPLLKRVLPKMHSIILRESISLSHFSQLGLDTNSVKVTTDLAFTLHHFYPNLYQKKERGPLNKIAFAFRPWKDSLHVQEIIEKAAALCAYLIDEKKIDLTFLSTCQGISDYHDDSLFAEKIISLLNPVQQSHCTIDRDYSDCFSLIQKYAEFDAYIGMRLHGAILSMLGGTPAMNIGYEDKTQGIFNALNLTDYQVHYSQPETVWCQTADLFLNDLVSIDRKLPEILDQAAKKALESFIPIQEYVRMNS